MVTACGSEYWTPSWPSWSLRGTEGKKVQAGEWQLLPSLKQKGPIGKQEATWVTNHLGFAPILCASFLLACLGKSKQARIKHPGWQGMELEAKLEKNWVSPPPPAPFYSRYLILAYMSKKVRINYPEWREINHKNALKIINKCIQLS